MPTYRDKGIVLRSKTLRDADRHYTVFTENHGKVVLLAKGTRRGKSKMAPHMGTFGVVDIMVAQGRVIDRLAGASLALPYHDIVPSLEKTSLAQSLLLAADALTKRELREPRVFALLQDFLSAIARSGNAEVAGRDLLFDAAVAKLLDILGFGLELRECTRCRKALSPRGNAINVMNGGVECGTCKDAFAMDVSDSCIKAMRFLREESFRAIPLLRLSPHTRREIGFVTDLLLTAHLEQRFSALQYLRAVSAV